MWALEAMSTMRSFQSFGLADVVSRRLAVKGFAHSSVEHMRTFILGNIAIDGDYGDRAYTNSRAANMSNDYRSRPRPDRPLLQRCVRCDHVKAASLLSALATELSKASNCEPAS